MEVNVAMQRSEHEVSQMVRSLQSPELKSLGSDLSYFHHAFFLYMVIYLQKINIHDLCFM